MKDNESVAAATHQRSPNYPACSLMESIGDARKVFGAEKRSVINQESLARSMGYGGLNGRSRTKIASLRKYGLVDNIGDGSQISQLAMRILHQPEDSADYLAAVREAAMRPDSFKEFFSTHREASEQSIASELILKRGFSPEGAKAFAKSFRETIVFAKLDQPSYSSPEAENKNKAEEMKSTPQAADTSSGLKAEPISLSANMSGSSTLSAVMSSLREFTVPLASGMSVLRVPYPMSEDDFDLFVGTLQLWKKRLVRKLTAIPPSVSLPANAMWVNGDNDKPVKIVAVMGERDGERYYQSEDGTGIPESQLVFSVRS